MSKNTWYYHETFRKHLSENENDNTSYYVVEEYGIKKFRILKFKDIATFIKQLETKECCKTINKCYYNIFFEPRRHLYLDFDIYLQHVIDQKDVKMLGKEVIRILVNFYNMHRSNNKLQSKALTLEHFYIFNSSRSGKFKKKSKQFAFKTSLHIYCSKIVFGTLSLLKNHVSILKKFANNYASLFNFPSDILSLAAHSFECIDESVYKDIQYFRCFQCCKYNEPDSIKKLMYPNDGVTYMDIIKIMQVDKCQKDDIYVEYKSTSSSLVKMISKNQVLSKSSSNINSAASIESKYIINYVFGAINNKLEWRETRVFKDSSIMKIKYSSINSNIEYPRCFIKLSGLSIKQMEDLNTKLKIPDIHIKDTYKSLFTHFKNDIPDEVEYVIYFNEDNIIFHHHTPSCIKKYSKMVYQYQRGLYAIYCKDCRRFYDI